MSDANHADCISVSPYVLYEKEKPALVKLIHNIRNEYKM